MVKMSIDGVVKNLENGKINRRSFLKKAGKGLRDLALLYAAAKSVGCKKVDPNGNGNGDHNAQLLILDFYKNHVSGVVSTDKGDYPINNGVANIVYFDPRCTINVNDHVIYEAKIDNRDFYTVIPNEWEDYFAHANVAGNGSNKFHGDISTYIDTSNGSGDYDAVVARLDVAGDGRASNIINDRDNANFIIRLDSDRNGHGEPGTSNGVITRCEINLLNSAQQPGNWRYEDVVDEEISQGLLHAEDVDPNVVPNEGENSCIAGYTKGWKSIDSNIMDALYSMKNCRFFGNGTCREN